MNAPTANAAQDERTAWLIAGTRLAQRLELNQVRLNILAAEAGLPAESFRHNFVDFKNYLIALQFHVLDELRTAVQRAISGRTPGFERLQHGAMAYLDGWLAYPGLRTWFKRAKRAAAQVAEGLRLQNQSFTLILSTEFHAMNWPHAMSGARLFVAVLQEAARAEHNAGKPNPALREEVWVFLKSYDEP